MAWPVDLKFCVNVEFVELSSALDFILDVTNYAELTDEQVREFLRERLKESKEVVNLDKLDEALKAELSTNMKNSNATAYMQDLFSSYITILSRYGLRWIITEYEKVAVQHAISTVWPILLKNRLKSDLFFSYHPLKKDFHGILKHAIRLAEAFRNVDPSLPGKRG